MKREIKFRGKRVDNGQWVYGDLVHDRAGWTYIIDGVGSSALQVDPDTVGQFINVKGYEGDYQNRHKNEVELFEGDIVEAMSQGSKGIFVITLRIESQPTWMLFPAWQQRHMWSISASDLGRDSGDYYDDLKRIGNINDNPELERSKTSKTSNF